jgi:hypothetical protein
MFISCPLFSKKPLTVNRGFINRWTVNKVVLMSDTALDTGTWELAQTQLCLRGVCVLAGE